MFFLPEEFWQEVERRTELVKEYNDKAKWDADKQCMKCGRDLHWVRMALVCKEHGLTKGC